MSLGRYKSLLKPVWALVVASVVALGIAAPAKAQVAHLDLVAADVVGTALQLINSQWVEIKAGDKLLGPEGVRTLKGGRLELQWGTAHISMGSEGAIAFEGSPRITSGGVVLFQYAGEVIVDCSQACTDGLTVRTPSIDVSIFYGTFVTDIAENGTGVSVVNGRATATSRLTGQHLTITSGDRVLVAEGDNGEIKVVAAGNGHKTSGTNGANGNGNGPGTNNGNTGSAGNNGGGNDPSGNNGNGNGSSGNNGNGKSSGKER